MMVNLRGSIVIEPTALSDNKTSIVLHPNVIHIWEVDLNKLNLGIAKLYIEALSNSEKSKLNSFKFINDYSSYLISHVVMRLLISNYSGIEAHKIRYRYKNNGKPWVLEGLNFNLSHSHKKAIIGFFQKEIGVDIEYKNEIASYNDIAELVFTSEEQNYMNKQDTRSRFYELWTKKEALTKAIGVGLEEGMNNLNICTKEEVYTHGQTWQVTRIESGLKYASHIAYVAEKKVVSINRYPWKF